MKRAEILQKLTEEKAELDIKLTALKTFLSSDPSSKIDEPEKQVVALHVQKSSMELYSITLEERINIIRRHLSDAEKQP